MFKTNILNSKRILVTGAGGQIGSDLVPFLRQRGAQVLATGRHPNPDATNYEIVDVTNYQRLQTVVEQYAIDTIYHLAGILSARGENHPEDCWRVNIDGLRNVLDLAKRYRLRVFWPSSIAVFGSQTPRFNTPQTTILTPSTLYGITKVTGELLCQYAVQKLGVDVRSLRLPGIISHRALPGGGTTDFAVEMFYAALQNCPYTCFVKSETRLPMMYIPDVMEAILQLMQADAKALTVHTSYNLMAMSFSAAELAAEIRRHQPNFICRYQPDFRQTIADSWPAVIDDTQARQDWGWQPTYDLPTMVQDMLTRLSARLEDSYQPNSLETLEVLSC